MTETTHHHSTKSDAHSSSHGRSDTHSEGHSKSNYGKFFAMIATSTAVMLALMYANTYIWTHLFWSETRFYMVFVMGAAMAIVMLTFMLGMYKSRTMNIAIYVGSILVFAVALWLVRSQTTVGDRSYMSAMIPHHSIAIMTSSRAGISDPRVRKLADEIIYAQDKEIAEMRYLIEDIEANGDGTEQQAPEASIVSVEEALSTAEIAILDPEFLTEADVAKLFPDGAECTFNFTTDAKPSVAMGTVDGSSVALMKVSGDLIRLNAARNEGQISLTTEGMAAAIAPTGDGEADDGLVESTLVFTLDAGARAGFIGWTKCSV